MQFTLHSTCRSICVFGSLLPLRAIDNSYFYHEIFVLLSFLRPFSSVCLSYLLFCLPLFHFFLLQPFSTLIQFCTLCKPVSFPVCLFLFVIHSFFLFFFSLSLSPFYRYLPHNLFVKHILLLLC